MKKAQVLMVMASKAPRLSARELTKRGGLKPYEYLFFRIGKVVIHATRGGVFAQDYEKNNKIK